MSVRFTGSGRRTVSAGLIAGLVAAAGVAVPPRSVDAPAPVMASPAVQLSAVVASLPLPAAAAPTPPPVVVPSTGGSAGNAIINAYNAVEPWAQYGVELGAWAVGWLPWPISLAAPQMNIAYNGIEPVVQASVYSVAYLIDGQTSLIGPTLVNGVQTGFNNFIQGELSWFASFFPPLPPINFPVLPGAATTVDRPAVSVPRVAAAVVAQPPADTAPAAQPPGDPVDPPVRRASWTPLTAPVEAPVSVPAPVAGADPIAAAETVAAPEVAGTTGDAAPSVTHPARAPKGHRGPGEGAAGSARAAASVTPGRSGRG